MADKEIGKITVSEDVDGKAVWEFEGKVQSDIPLDTAAQDFAGAINELKKLSAQGGGDGRKPWTRPSDWPALPAPRDNQIVFLVSTARNTSPYCSLTTRPLDKYAFPENKGEYPEGLTMSVNWGDGHISNAARKDAAHMEWTNPFGTNNPAAGTASVEYYAGNCYCYYSGASSDSKKFWNPGGTKLDDGTVAFTVTVTVSDPDNVVIGWPQGSDVFEAYIGKNINIDVNDVYYYSYHLQHVKAFGWQPGKNKDKKMSSYNSDTGVVYWNTSGLFGNNFNLRKVEATEPFTEIPDNMFKYVSESLEIDLSEAARIGENAFGYACLLNGGLELDKCGEIGKNAFRECSGISSVNAPALVSAGTYAFQGCFNLKTVNAENLEGVSASAFENCFSLFKINIPKAEFVAANGFYNCRSLEDINAPLLEGLGGSAFYGCYSLQELTSPVLREAGQNAFANCFALKKLVCAEGADLSRAALNYSFLWYDNPALQQYRPKDIN